MKSRMTNFLIYMTIFVLSFCIYSAQAQDRNPADLKPIDSESFEVMSQFFDYDKSIPLEARIVDISNQTNYVREKIVFQGINDSRVPGYLALPKYGTGPYPCVLVLHGIGDSKESWWKDTSFNSGGQLTKQLIDSGFAVLTLDAEYHGERLINNDYESPDVFIFQKGWFLKARNMIVQSVAEYRRALDYLETRKEIDSSSIGAIGYSMGGMMVFNLCSTDTRIKVAVASVTPILKENYSALAVYNFAPYINSIPFLMLNGENDSRNYSIHDAQQLYELIKSNKKNIKFFESGHKLPLEWTKNAVEWITEHLN